MKIQLYTGSSRRGVSEYVIQPERVQENRHPFPEEVERLRSFRWRIALMAQQELGDDFIELKELGSLLVLKVKVGTSTRKRFELRALAGWIELFDHEPERTSA